MVCYICGKPASFRCPVCGRYACNEHTRSTDGIKYFDDWLGRIGDSFQNLPHYICDTCFKQATEYSNAETQTRYHATHQCDWHNILHDDIYLANDKWGSELGIVYCGKCKKQICADSTIKGPPKEIYYYYKSGDSGGWDHCEQSERADRLFILTPYLCPICKASVVMFSRRDYEIVHEYGWFSTKRRVEYQGDRKIGAIYSYDNEKHEFVMNVDYTSY